MVTNNGDMRRKRRQDRKPRAFDDNVSTVQALSPLVELVDLGPREKGTGTKDDPKDQPEDA
jgi:hypothetical protein